MTPKQNVYKECYSQPDHSGMKALNRKDKEKLLEAFGHIFFCSCPLCLWGIIQNLLFITMSWSISQCLDIEESLFNFLIPLELICKWWYSLIHQLWTFRLLCIIYRNDVTATMVFNRFPESAFPVAMSLLLGSLLCSLSLYINF